MRNLLKFAVQKDDLSWNIMKRILYGPKTEIWF